MADIKATEAFPREFPGVHYYDSSEEEAVLRVIRSKSMFRYYGANFLAEVDSLEREFAAHKGRKYAQALASGTSSLAAALTALEVGPGQEVLIPGFMWVSTVGTVVRAGAIPVLVEIDESFNMDPEDLAAKITPKSTMVFPVHMCGVPADMPAIIDIASRNGLRSIEDCAQANGASLNGKAVGTWSDLAVFSFQMNKNITAGEGGIVVTDDEQLYLRANAAQDLGVPWSEGMPIQDGDIALWGTGTRMSELAASVIRAQLPKLPTIVSNMRDRKIRIKEALSDLKDIRFRKIADPQGDSGPFIIATFKSAEKAAAFAREASVNGLGVTYMPNYGLHIYYNIKALVEKRSNSPAGYPWSDPANAGSDYSYTKGSLPRTDELLEKSVVVPVPSIMTSEQEARYISIFRNAHKAVVS